MDLEELALPLTAFKLAKSDGIQTMIFGCGIGPLFNKKFELATKKILELADVIKLRDQKSVDIATRWTHGKKNITLSGDPAKVYLNAKYAELQVPVKNILTCYLRDWTHEYAANLTEEDFLAQKEKMEAGLAQLIKQRAKTFGVEQIVLDHMHNFVVGNDDRDFSRYFIKKYFHDSEIPVTYNRKLSTIDSIVNAMKSSKHNICMRFHSVVFAHTLGADFTAFDYTLGGKILNYLTDNDQLQRMVTVNDIINIE
jgi:polysaccharide pyruvyl transferase WcaK-like protein